MGLTESSSKKEIHSNTGLTQETRKTSNNLTLHQQALEKGQTKPKVSRSKEIIKIRAQINKIVYRNNRNGQSNQEWFIEKISNIGEPLARLMEKKERGPK